MRAEMEGKAGGVEETTCQECRIDHNAKKRKARSLAR